LVRARGKEIKMIRVTNFISGYKEKIDINWVRYQLQRVLDEQHYAEYWGATLITNFGDNHYSFNVENNFPPDIQILIAKLYLKYRGGNKKLCKLSKEILSRETLSRETSAV
jgi:hypothetical protein